MKLHINAIFWLMLFIAASTSTLLSQNIPNGDFEQWTPSGKEPPFNWEEPTGWKTNNAVVEFIGATVRRGGMDGDYYCKIESTNIFGNKVPGMLVLGSPTLDFSTYSVNAITGGMALTGEPPTKLTGRYQFTSTSAGDKAAVAYILKKYNNETNQRDTIGINMKLLDLNPDSFVDFSMDITKNMSQENPDSIIVIFLSSNPMNVLEGGSLRIDDVNLVYGTDDVESEVTENGFSVFPNPANDLLTIEFPENAPANSTIEIIDLAGKLYSTFPNKPNGSKIDISGIPNGVYIVKASEIRSYSKLLVIGR